MKRIYIQGTESSVLELECSGRLVEADSGDFAISKNSRNIRDTISGTIDTSTWTAEERKELSAEMQRRWARFSYQYSGMARGMRSLAATLALLFLVFGAGVIFATVVVTLVMTK